MMNYPGQSYIPSIPNMSSGANNQSRFGKDFWGGIGSLMGALGLSQQNFTNPADAAKGYLDKIPGTITPYYDPYINSGKQAMQKLMEQFGILTSDPASRMKEFGQSFQQSPGYQFQVDQALGAANRAAAAGGMLGSPMEQQNVAGAVNQLANQDYYNYLDRVMGLYGKGLSGMEGINQLGYQASNALAGDLSNVLGTQAQLAYQGQNAMNQAQGGQNAGIWGLLGSAASNLLPLLFQG